MGPCSYFTNTLILPEINGPTEGLMLIYLAHFLTAIIGNSHFKYAACLKIVMNIGKYNIFLILIVGPAWWAQKAGDVFYIFKGFPVLSGKHMLTSVVNLQSLNLNENSENTMIFTLYQMALDEGDEFSAYPVGFIFWCLLDFWGNHKL
jgi:hypothetical protein